MLWLRSLLLEMFPKWLERREVLRRAADNKAVLDALKTLRQRDEVHDRVNKEGGGS
jgi:hypothetical protein